MTDKEKQLQSALDLAIKTLEIIEDKSETWSVKVSNTLSKIELILSGVMEDAKNPEGL